jgi:hypothetical protein
MLVEFFKLSERIATLNFVQIKNITLNCAYYKIVQLKLRYEYSTTVIFHKSKVRLPRNCSLNGFF